MLVISEHSILWKRLHNMAVFNMFKYLWCKSSKLHRPVILWIWFLFVFVNSKKLMFACFHQRGTVVVSLQSWSIRKRKPFTHKRTDWPLSVKIKWYSRITECKQWINCISTPRYQVITNIPLFLKRTKEIVISNYYNRLSIQQIPEVLSFEG